MPSSRDRKRASGISSCESGKKKTRLPRKFIAVRATSARGPLACRRGHGLEMRRIDSESVGRGAQPRRRAFDAQRKGCGKARAPRSSSARAVSARNGCASRKDGADRPGAGRRAPRRGESEPDRCPAREQPLKLIFDDIGQGADDEQG